MIRVGVDIGRAAESPEAKAIGLRFEGRTHEIDTDEAKTLMVRLGQAVAAVEDLQKRADNG